MRMIPSRTSLGLTLIACVAFGADQKPGFRFVSASERGRAIDQTYEARVSGFIWGDKVVYRPGEALTLRGTIRANGDEENFTLFAYRVNNQTGVKTFLPGGTTDATDAFGKTREDGYQPFKVVDFEKAVLIGANGLIVPAPATIPDELGMHTIVAQLRDAEGQRILKTFYFKLSVVDEIVTVPNEITADTTWVRTKSYRLNGLTYVRSGTLTIESGTIVTGNTTAPPNPSALIITANARINASGTRSRPIIFTSTRNPGERARGDWGGLIMIGKGPVNFPSGFGNVEGLPDSPDTRYGGDDVNHNCGTLRYVRSEFAGSILGPGNEINGITWAGCGRATVAEYLQSHYGLDDAFEWFGGTVDGKYLVASYAQDDFYDWQIGWTGRLQYIVAIKNQDQGNRGIEADNNSNPMDGTPRSRPVIFNATFVGNPEGVEEDTNANAGIWLRRGTGGSLNNFLVTNWNQTGFEIRDVATAQQAAEGGTLTVNGMMLWDNGKDRSKPNTIEGQVNSANTPADVAAPLLALTQRKASQVVAADPLLRRAFDYSDPDLRPAVNSPLFRANWVQAPDNAFWDQSANFLGAFGTVNWAEEWTTFIQEGDMKVN